MQTAGDGCRSRFDNEEIGSATKQGADSTFLYDTVRRINEASGKFSLEAALCDSFMLSLDNSHAIHPNRPEKAIRQISVTWERA